MNLLARFSAWFERTFAPPERPAPPSILTHPQGQRTFKLVGRSTGWISTTSWTNFDPHYIGEFVEEFTESNGGDPLLYPYVQFYAGDMNTPSSMTGVVTFDAKIKATFRLARGKIKPTKQSEATYINGQAVFTWVRLEFTVSETDQVLYQDVRSVTITPSGEIVVVE